MIKNINIALPIFLWLLTDAISLRFSTCWAQKSSPSLSEEMYITFSVEAPRAKEVRLVWEKEKTNLIASKDLFFERKDSGVWQLTLSPIPPDIYFYAFTIDGKHQRDPLNSTVLYKHGLPYSMLTVPIFPHDTYHLPLENGVFYGEIQNRTYFSKRLKVNVELNLYVPYQEHWKDSLSIVFLLHDEQFKGTDWFLLGKIQWVLDHLLQKGRITPALVVMPDLTVSTTKRKTVHAASSSQGDEIIAMLQELWEWFPQATRKSHLIGIGSSAERCFQLCANHPLLFEKIAVLSGEPVKNEAILQKAASKIILTADAMETVANPSALHRQLEHLGIAHDNYQMRGIRRNWVFWKHVLYEKFFPSLLSVTP